MLKSQYEMKRSITKRLKLVMMAIAFFFIVGALSIYLSSFSFLQGVQKMHSANKILNFTTQSIDALETSNENLRKLSENGNLDDIKFSFSESQKHLVISLRESLDSAEENIPVKELLEQGLDAVFLYEQNVISLFRKFDTPVETLNETELNSLKSEILVANQFAIDAKEFLRKAQIHLQADTNRIFNSIYQDRFQPLFVGITLSALFFLFVVTFGFTTAGKISESLKNLVTAAEVVKNGNLSYQAPILDQNEFGLLTSTFNKMVLVLKEGREKLDFTIERIRDLQKITAGYSESLTTDEVVELTIREGFKTLSANIGAIAILNEEKDTLIIRESVGLTDDSLKKWKTSSMESNNPATVAIKEGKPLFYSDQQKFIEHFSLLEEEIRSYGQSSFAVIPLMVGDLCLGAISLVYDHKREFPESEQDFLIAITQQCAQALHRSQLYDESRLAIQARDEFLSIASHELKTPLTPLKLQLQLLGRKLKQGASFEQDKVLAIMDNSDRQLNRLSRLIEDLLDVSRITSGKLTLNLEKINLTTILKEVIEQYQHQLKTSSIHIKVKSEEDVMILGDLMRIEQVIVNILTNAAKYAPGKPIEVVLKKTNSKAILSIKDHGPGIAKENRDRIFQRFERVKANDNIGGLGLGLYISHQIIEAHQGNISVESEVGEGSKFTIELPMLP